MEFYWTANNWKHQANCNVHLRPWSIIKLTDEQILPPLINLLSLHYNGCKINEYMHVHLFSKNIYIHIRYYYSATNGRVVTQKKFNIWLELLTKLSQPDVYAGRLGGSCWCGVLCSKTKTYIEKNCIKRHRHIKQMKLSFIGTETLKHVPVVLVVGSLRLL